MFLFARSFVVLFSPCSRVPRLLLSECLRPLVLEACCSGAVALAGPSQPLLPFHQPHTAAMRPSFKALAQRVRASKTKSAVVALPAEPELPLIRSDEDTALALTLLLESLQMIKGAPDQSIAEQKVNRAAVHEIYL